MATGVIGRLGRRALAPVAVPYRNLNDIVIILSNDTEGHLDTVRCLPLDFLDLKMVVSTVRASRLVFDRAKTIP
jgi:hypothetical protein